MLELLLAELQTAGLGTIGTNLFVHRMDAACKTGLMLRIPPGTAAKVSVYLPGFLKQHVQMIVRAPDQATGDALIANGTKALTTQQVKLFNDTNGNLQMQLNHLVPATMPTVYPRLDGQGLEWSVDLDVCYVIPDVQY